MLQRLLSILILTGILLVALMTITSPIYASPAAIQQTENRQSASPSDLLFNHPPGVTACQGLPDAECIALQLLYLQSGGDSWVNNNGWLTSPKPCDWYGVTCQIDSEGVNHVYGIDLSWNGLQGNLAAGLNAVSGVLGSASVSLNSLSKLKILDLSGNQLSGAIPDDVANLQELRILDLSENQFVGELPAAIGNLAQLKLLHLFENDLFGSLPLTITQMTQLQNLKIQNTHLCIPNDSELQAWLDNIYYLSLPAAADCLPANQSPKPLVLIYAVLDNDLNSEWGRLVNNAEQGVRDGSFDVRLMVDAKGENNSYDYTLQQDSDPSCPSIVTGDYDCNRYRWRRTVRAGLENSAQRDALINFVANGILAHPNASQIVLSLVGHGSGWGANALPAQPRPWRELSGLYTDTLGGMLWDDTTGDGLTETQSLSTQALGSALREVKLATGRTIDLLYLDACSMAMAEVAYEIRGTVDMLLASENTKWAVFPYDQLLPMVAETIGGRALGEKWLESEVAILSQSSGYPYTYSLIDIAAMDRLITTTSALADALIPLMPTMHLEALSAFSQTSHFDSNYDGEVNAQDAYVDLYDFAGQIAAHFSAQPEVVSAAAAVQTAVQSAVVRTIFEDDLPPSNMTDASIWTSLGGISIYLPLAKDEEKRSGLYNRANLDWAEQGSWDEFLATYWQSVADSADRIAVEQCAQTSDCPTLSGWESYPYTPTQPTQPTQQLYLPLVLN